jgi:pimeloyl-ACP methyl ester carboxylesterase
LLRIDRVRLSTIVLLHKASIWEGDKSMYVPARSQKLSETIIYPIEQPITEKNPLELEEIKPDIRSCFALLITAVPFSMFLLCVALGQGNVNGFYLCILSACLIASLPFVGAILMAKTYERLIADNTVEPLQELDGDVCCKSPLTSPTASVQTIPLSLLECYKNQTDWLWQGWKVRYTFIHNPQSQVPVILLHGFGGSIGHWRQNIAELAKHHSVYALDLLGFGASEKPAAPYGIPLWTEQVYEFWKTFVQVPAVLVGNSIGSVTCLAAAATHPEMARGVAMISLPDTSGSEECIPASLRPLVRKLKSAFVSPLLLQPLFHLLRQPYILRRWVGLAYACKEAITDELLEIISAPARELGSAKAFCAILKAMLSPKFSPCITSILSNLQIPSLLLSGEKDRMVPPTSARRFLGYNLLLQLVELENAGHCAHDECPERVNQELLNWIQTRVLAV